MTDLITRTLTLDRKLTKGDVFPAVLATETPVERDGFFEVLDMQRIDLSRAPLPFIESHDTGRLNIGVGENLRPDGDKLRGDVRIGNSTRGRELAEDIRARIVQWLSIGYRTSDPVEVGERDGLPVYSFAFQPIELSAVSVPADSNAGFYRSDQTLKTEDKLNRSEPKRANQDSHQDSHDEQERAAAIRSMANQHDLPELGMQALAEGWSLEDFNRRALNLISSRNDQAMQRKATEPSRARNTFSFDNNRYDERVMSEYSISRAIRALVNPREQAGIELEVSQDMQKLLGRDSQGIIVPFEALSLAQRSLPGVSTRAITIGGSGANLVPEDHLGGSFIDVLRNASYVMKLGPRVLRGLVGDVDIPRKTAGAAGYWIAGDDSDSITESDITFDSVSLSPKTVGGVVRTSHKALRQSSPDVEQVIRTDLLDLIAQQIDIKGINGSGSSNQPLGILNTTGINSIPLDAAEPTYDELVDMETALAVDNADMGNLAWLMDPAMAKVLRTTPKQGSGVEGNFIWPSDSKSVLSIPAYRTGNMPAGYVLLGNWQHLLVGFWGGIELLADPYGTNFNKGSVSIRVLADVDIGVRHPVAFCEAHHTP